jgi:transcriptional regulator with XRE-family HTH domain
VWKAAAWFSRSSSWLDTVYGVITPGELIRERRISNGFSQRRLAYRAGTSQSAIARIERGDEEVTWSRLRSILVAMGEEPVLSSRTVGSRYDAADLNAQRRVSPELRLEGALRFNTFASEMARAGRKARQGGSQT